ncbi:GNAT family N-acetyltransferase [Streptosporangium sp. NPDC002721]|uniref:GNAT family N-acetyltransferase n=1 Tax=Streptosporangium sp. NPDC002721 TaxID=3366188 RepID=UPI003686FBB8
MSQDRLTALAEGAEAEFMYQYESSAPPSARSTLGIATTRIGGGVALSMRHDVTGYWSKALGFGVEEPVTRDLIDRVVDFYRAEDSEGAVIQIAPSALPPDWDDIRAGHGIVPGSAWVKLTCPIDDFRPGRTALRVGPVGPGEAEEWASVVLRGFGMPEEGLGEMMAASAGHPAFRPFAAWDGDDMVAGANLFVHGEIGSLNAASTLPGHRNRGAQSALLAARAEEAAKAGCRRLVAEAGLPAEGSANPSLNNMLAAGLRPLYDRQNWIWRPDTGPTGGS